MNKKGILFILAAAVLWGTTGTAQALAPAGARPLGIGTLRLLVGGATLMLYYLTRQKATGNLPRSRLPVGPVLLAAACMAAYQVLFFAGVARTGVAVGTMVGIGSSPILAGILGFLTRGERPGRYWGLATLLAVAGCALLALAGKEIQVDPFGLLLAVGAGAAYATFSLTSKGLLEQQPVERVMAAIFGLGAVLLLPLLLTQDLSWLLQPGGIITVLHLGLLATALAYIFFGQGLLLTPLATAVTLSLAEPLTAALLGVTLLGEKLTLPAGLGIALIFSGLAILSLQKPKRV
ncbi:MAG: EamA family transporter [Anaerolineaceae bacterium]|nr:EamA family transporter [Anaerolineaceae bacterium]